MTATHTVANADAIAVVAHFIRKECDHVPAAIAGCINGQGNIAGWTEKVHDLPFGSMVEITLPTGEIRNGQVLEIGMDHVLIQILKYLKPLVRRLYAF